MLVGGGGRRIPAPGLWAEGGGGGCWSPSLSPPTLGVTPLTCCVLLPRAVGSPLVMDPTSICRKARRLAGRQAELCQEEPEVVAELARGARLGVRECQFQFRFRRWNCSSHSKAFGRILQQGQCEEGTSGLRGEGGGLGRLPEPHLSHKSLGTLPRPCLPAPPHCPAHRSPLGLSFDAVLTAPPCPHRHPGDRLRLCHHGGGRQPCSHAGLLHGRAAAVWLPGTPQAGPTAAPWPARHPWAPWPCGLPRGQCSLGVGRLWGRCGFRGREVQALYGREA